MSYEAKVILIALANEALRDNAKGVYNLIIEMANADGIVFKPFDEAKAAL
jgi:hypothetical protein